MSGEYLTLTFVRPYDHLYADCFLQQFVSPDAHLPNEILHYALSDDGMTAYFQANWAAPIGDTELEALAAYLLAPDVALEDLPGYVPPEEPLPPPEEFPANVDPLLEEPEYPAELGKTEKEAQGDYGDLKAVTVASGTLFVAIVHDGEDSHEQALQYRTDTNEAKA